MSILAQPYIHKMLGVVTNDDKTLTKTVVVLSNDMQKNKVKGCLRICLLRHPGSL